jgi:phenylacetate-CoA ligase
MSNMDRTTGYLREDLETMSADQRSAYLDQKVAEIAAHAYANSPAVKAIMDKAGAAPGDIKGVADLSGLPITEKADLVALQRENLPFGGFEGEPVGQMRRVYVSPGPIYEPCERVFDDDRWSQAFYAAGFRAPDKGQITFNFNMVPFAFMLDEALSMMGCISVPTGVGNSEQQVQVLKDLQVEAYLGTPSFLAILADKAEEMGLDLKNDLNLQVAFVAAEMLPESLRSSLQERLGMLIRQSYGTADVGCLSYECYHMGGMHFAQNCVVEVVDPDTGQPVEEGQPGEVVATVFNPTYPLIRFGTGDLSAFSTEPCACGRTDAKLTRIMGRVDQMTKVRGMFVHPGGVKQVADKYPRILACQLVVDRKENQDVMTLVCEMQEPGGPELKAELEQEIKEALRVKGLVEFVAPGSLPKDCKLIEDRRVWD